jgi:hypothetical protein
LLIFRHEVKRADRLRGILDNLAVDPERPEARPGGNGKLFRAARYILHCR